MACSRCNGQLEEISFVQALQLTRKRSLEKQISSQATRPDAYKEYLIRRYLGDDSLFLLYDIARNRLKHGRDPKRFFIQPINFTAFFNIPWFLFNVLSTNSFHMSHTGFCERCSCKFIPGRHSREECDYNTEYFSIIDDVMTGNIVNTRFIYKQYGSENKKQGKRSAYYDLFERRVKVEAFFDLLSIGLSLMFWVFIVIYITFPFIKAFFQDIYG
ncbi:MAG: hypothetical protein AB1650_08005 [Candidatus Omnitrophota bacterium]